MFLVGNRKYNTRSMPNLTVLLAFVARFPYIPGSSDQNSLPTSRRDPPLCLNRGKAELFFPKCRWKTIRQAYVYLSAFVRFKPFVLRVAKEIFFKHSRIQAIKCFPNIKQFHSQNLLPLVSLSVSRKHFPFMLTCYLKCFLKRALSVLFVSR